MTAVFTILLALLLISLAPLAPNAPRLTTAVAAADGNVGPGRHQRSTSHWPTLQLLFGGANIWSLFDTSSSSSSPSSSSSSSSLNNTFNKHNYFDVTTESYQRVRHLNCSQYIAITFVNGICYTDALFERVTTQLRFIFGQPIFPFYNPSTGSFVNDLTNAGLLNIIRPNDKQVAKDLAIHLRQVLTTLHPRGRILHIAHSAGAIVTYLAARYHLTPNERARIDVTTFGGGRSITRKHFHGRIVNYYSANDPLAIIDRRTAHIFHHAARSAASEHVNGTAAALTPQLQPSSSTAISITPVGMAISAKSANTIIEVLENKHNTTFVFLKGLANDPFADHYMDGPTYAGGLRIEANAYYDRVWAIVQQQWRDESVIRKFRKHAANATGVHHFWKMRWLNLTATSAKVNRNSSFSGLFDITWLPLPVNATATAIETVRNVRKWSAAVTGCKGFFSGKYAQANVTAESES